MKQEYAEIKSILARIIYRNMYGANYEPASSEAQLISDHVNEINKRALSIAVKDKNEEISLGQYCLVTFESPVRKADSQLNKKALKISG